MHEVTTMAEQLYKADELAAIFGVHPETIRRLGREGRIERYKCGASVRYVMPKKEVKGSVKQQA